MPPPIPPIAAIAPTIANLRRVRPRSSRSKLLSSDTPAILDCAIIENLLYAHVEQPRQPEGQRQRRIVLAGLDRIDRLARDADPAAKLRLAPASFRPQDPQSILHSAPSGEADLVSVRPDYRVLAAMSSLPDFGGHFGVGFPSLSPIP